MLKRLLAPSEARDVILVLAVSLLLWEAGVRIFQPPPLILPAPSAIVGAFLQTPGLFMRQQHAQHDGQREAQARHAEREAKLAHAQAGRL